MTPQPPMDPRRLQDGNTNVPPVPGPAAGPGGPAAPPAPPPAVVNAPPTGPALLKALRRRWQLAAVIASVGSIAVAAGVYFFMPPAKHTVRTQFVMNPAPVDPLNGRRAEVNPESFKQTQATKLKSSLVINQALKDKKVAELSLVRDCDDIVNWFEREAKITASSEILSVTLASEKPEEARILLDAVTKAYLQEFVTGELEARQNRYIALKKVKDDYDKEAKRISDQKLKLKQGGNGAQAAIQAQMLAQELTIKRDSLYKVQTEKLALEAKAKAMGDSDPSKLPLNDSTLVAYYRKSSSYLNLEREVDEAQLRLQDARQKVVNPDDSTIVRKIKSDIEKLEKALADEQRRLRPEAEAFLRSQTAQFYYNQRQAVEEEVAIKTNLERSLTRDIQKGEETLADLRAGNVQSELFEKVNAGAEEFQRQVQLELEKMRLNPTPEPRVRLIEEARIIPADETSRRLKMAGIGFIVTIAAVLVAIALWEFRSRRVENTDQVIFGLGLPLVGTVPAMPQDRFLGLSGRLQQEEFEQWRFALQEAVATARTMLLNAARTSDMRLVMVTSAMPGEGKTSLSTQLAVSMSMAGYRTLLLDFDMRNPSAFKLMGATNGPGWAEILRGELNVVDAVQQTAMENLWFIPAGECDPLALKSLAQEELGDVLKWLKGQYDFVIVDTCPILPVVDPLLLGRHVDGVIFSILSEVSQIPKVYTATQRIKQLGIPLMGAVINGVREEKYGYGYGYGYGYNYRSGRSPRKNQIEKPVAKNA